MLVKCMETYLYSSKFSWNIPFHDESMLKVFLFVFDTAYYTYKALEALFNQVSCKACVEDLCQSLYETLMLASPGSRT